jgi:hypothetical protein
MRKNSWILLAAGLALSAPALAASREAALGVDGEVYQVKSGAYGDLFPGVQELVKDNPVLAIDMTKPGAPPLRVLVPNTGDADLESSASLLYEQDSQTLFVLWESQNGLHPVLKLAGFDGSHWSTPILVTGNPFAPKTSPQLAITRESFEDTTEDEAVVTKHRTTLHLVWQEDGSAAGSLDTLYTPIVFIDGVYTGANPIYNLGDLLPENLTPGDANVPASLLRAPIIQAGRDERTVVVAFASAATRQLVTVEVDVLPEQLSRLAEKARSHIIEIGRALFPADLPSLAEKARSHIIEIGVAFHPEVRGTLADQVKAAILAGGADTLEALAEKARSHIIEIGAKLSSRGLRNPGDAPAAKIVQIQGASNSPVVPPEPYLLQFRIASSRPAPRIGSGAVKLFVSEAGDDVLVSWALTDRVVYRISRDGGWSDPKELRFSDSLNLAKAYEILDQRVRNR